MSGHYIFINIDWIILIRQQQFIEFNIRPFLYNSALILLLLLLYVHIIVLFFVFTKEMKLHKHSYT